MFRYLLLKYLELEEKLDRSQERTEIPVEEETYNYYDEMPEGIGNFLNKAEKWFDTENNVLIKAESLKREYRREYRRKLKELLGGD